MNNTCLWIAVLLLVLAAIIDAMDKPHSKIPYYLSLAFVVLSVLVEEILVKTV